MSIPSQSVLLCLLLATTVGVCCTGTGCAKAKPPSESAANVEAGFRSTEPQVKEFAQQGIEAERKQDYSTAFAHYRDLSVNPDLTPEQRNLASQAMLKMGAKLRQAATNGDAQAEQTLQMYRATK